MECERFRPLLYLYRHGELSEREQRRLEVHVSSCPRCSREREAIETMGHAMHRLHSFEPAPEDPQGLTAHVMAGIRAPIMPHAPARVRGIVDWLSAVARPRSVRLAAASVAVLLLGTFLHQVALTVDQVSRLEEKMAERAAPAVRPTVEYSVRIEDARQVVDIDWVRRMAGILPAIRRDGLLVVNGVTVMEFKKYLERSSLSRSPAVSPPGMEPDAIDRLLRFLQSHVEVNISLGVEGV